jgi:hypothetical protein
VIERRRNRSEINEPDRYSAAHNGLVAGSNPAGPTNEIMGIAADLTACNNPCECGQTRSEKNAGFRRYWRRTG